MSDVRCPMPPCAAHLAPVRTAFGFNRPLHLTKFISGEKYKPQNTKIVAGHFKDAIKGKRITKECSLYRY